MDGQWIEFNDELTDVPLVMNVDNLGSHFEATVYFRHIDPPVFLKFRFTDSRRFEGEADRTRIFTFDPRRNHYALWRDAKDSFGDGTVFPEWVRYSAAVDGRNLNFMWSTNLGKTTHQLSTWEPDQPSMLDSTEMSWNEFKTHVSSLGALSPLFRGQSTPWKLRTSFHRKGRADIFRFLQHDVPMLHRHLSSRTRHLFDLSSPDQTGAFLNLAQHHGYPTPLLDWTYSPFIAAFFAFRGITNSSSRREPVRIVVLDPAWMTEFPQLPFAERPGLNFSILNFIALENERVIPQQSVSAISNVDDIESYIAMKQRSAKRAEPYLSAIDIPASERRAAFRELAYMGITAGALFPGLDGACEELKERNFVS